MLLLAWGQPLAGGPGEIFFSLSIERYPRALWPGVSLEVPTCFQGLKLLRVPLEFSLEDFCKGLPRSSLRLLLLLAWGQPLAGAQGEIFFSLNASKDFPLIPAVEYVSRFYHAMIMSRGQPGLVLLLGPLLSSLSLSFLWLPLGLGQPLAGAQGKIFFSLNASKDSK